MEENEKNSVELTKQENTAIADVSPLSNSKTKKSFFEKNWFFIIIMVLILCIVLLSLYLRTQNISELKDITTGNYTLGPDLDPFLYLRNAEEIISGNLKNPDMMRQAPLGCQNYARTSLMPWAIVFIYKILNIFFEYPTASIEFAAIIAPVIFFSLTLIAFFLSIFVIFSFSMKKKFSAVAALIATLFYAVVPEMLHRTVAGIPEIESLGMLWFWLAFLFFALAWKQEKIKKMFFPSLIAGVFTGLMIYSWGGFRYVFMTFSLTAFLIFFFNKEKKKNFVIFSLWFIPAFIFSITKIGLNSTIESLSDTGFGLIIFLILLLDMILFNTNLKKIREKIKLPESVISLIIVALLGIFFSFIINPGLITKIVSKISLQLLHPFGAGRIGLTVAENNSPYFVQVFASFLWVFWLFFLGTIVLFYLATKHFNKKNRWWLNILFMVFLITFIFSRISPNFFLFEISSLALDGESGFSKLLYFGGLSVFVLFLIISYARAYIKKDEKTLNDFKEINFSYFLLIALTFWSIISMRGAIRLFFIISPALIIMSAYLPVKISELSFKTKEIFYKILLWCLVILIVLLLIITFINFEKTTDQQAKWTINGPYYFQWQKAMAWVRNTTPEDSFFVHWWDYGYWIQTLGKRATVTDGGHANAFFDHTTARYLMTAQNEKTALQLCKAHNVSYFLIDSTDIGKYGAFAKIGSDKTGLDRYTTIGTFFLNEKQTQETKNETAHVYLGGVMIDEDIILKDGQILPIEKSGIGAFILYENQLREINRITAVAIYKNQRYDLPIKYYWVYGKKYETDAAPDSLNGGLYFIPAIDEYGKINELGAALYLSEKALKAEWVKLYLLNQTDNFELVHSEPAIISTQKGLKTLLEVEKENNLKIGDFLFMGDLKGPIKIWKVKYPQNIQYYPEYLETNVIMNETAWAKLDYLGI